MGTELPTVLLGELLSEDRGISVGVMYPGDHDPCGIPLIKAGDLVGGRINPALDFRISPEVHHQYRRTELVGGELLMTLVGDVGRCAVVPQSMRGWNAARAIAVMRFKEPGEAAFVRLCLQSPLVRHLMDVWSNTTVQQTLNLKELRVLPLPWPSPAERVRIAHILGTLDDKIDLNRRTNETLEAMARALFKSWFVDFDPVRAKAEGRQPAGMDPEMAKLFPSEFVESELGEIPEGWSCQPLSGWASALSGGTPAKNTPGFWGGTIPWISPKAMMSIHADESDEMVTAQALVNGTRLAPRGSCLVMVRGMGLHEEVRVSQAQRDLAFNQDVKALVPQRINPSLLLFAMLDGQEDLLLRVESSGHGTGRLPSDILLSHSITMPPEEVQKLFGANFEEMNSRIDAIRNETRVLASVRDALLPRLLSGELTVPNAERTVEAGT